MHRHTTSYYVLVCVFFFFFLLDYNYYYEYTGQTAKADRASCIIICLQDLAARNVLMDQNELCKVGDFGLLRKATKNDGENYAYMMQLYLTSYNFSLTFLWILIATFYT